MEVESMGRGYLGTIQVPIGETVPVGTLIAMLNDEPENCCRLASDKTDRFCRSSSLSRVLRYKCAAFVLNRAATVTA